MHNTLEAALKSFFAYQMANVWTSIPCVVLTDLVEDEMHVDIQPLVEQLYQDGEVVRLPPIFSIPVQMPGTMSSQLHIPIKKGDTGVCIFSQRGIDNFKAGSGDFSPPSDYRRFDKRDGIFIPGVYPFSESPTKKRVVPVVSGELSLTNNIGTTKEATIAILPTGEISVRSTNGVVNVQCNTANLLATNATVTLTGTAAVTCPATVWTGNINFTGAYNFTGTVFVNGTPVP